MSRPEFVSNADIARWDENINKALSSEHANNTVLREVCYAGQWLGEQLAKLNCPEEYNIRIVFTAGQLAVGRDPWDVVDKLLTAYKQNDLKYEPDPEPKPYSLN